MKDVPGAAGKTGHPLLGKKSRFSPNLIGQVKARLGISRDMKNAMCLLSEANRIRAHAGCAV